MTNSLTNKINADAEAQIATIVAGAAVEVSEVQKETERVVSVLQNEAATMLAKKKSQMELVTTAKAEQTAKIIAQAAKREAIDGLFAKVEAEVLDESGVSYVARYTKRAQAVLPNDLEVLSVEAPIEKTAETKEILTSLGIAVVATETTSVRAGLIITAKDGVYDVSFDRMMSEARPTLEMELVNTPS
jgi:vacuolar-type H+-ATPase subunit E/Vma4